MPRLTIPGADSAVNGAAAEGAEHLPLLMTGRQSAELCPVSQTLCRLCAEIPRSASRTRRRSNGCWRSWSAASVPKL